MSAIVGLINLDGGPVGREPLLSMTRMLSHRGPDGEGIFLKGPAGLGHRSLFTCDQAESGAQPISDPGGYFTLIYDGKIYNCPQLRRELESLGHSFRSESDSEVILCACMAWREKAVARFNGMFALALFDAQRRRLFLARDRYGIKPLYYAFSGQKFLFASEQKALLAHPSFRPTFDYEALLEYFTFQNIFSDKTFFEGLRVFPSASYAFLPLDAGSLDIRRYWDWNFREPEKPAPAEACREELERLFKQAVKRQIRGEANLGAYLSGGLDSGAITAVASVRRPYMKSFTCGFDLHSAGGLELGVDEREAAEYMSYLFKTEHYEMVLKAGDMERIMPRLAWHLEEPRVGQSYPNYYVAGLASKFVKTVLSGAGGDELFAGYPWRYYRAAVNKDFDDYIDKYYLFWQRLIPNSVLKNLFRPVWGKMSHILTRDIFCDVFKDRALPQSPEDYINHSLYFEARTFLPGLLAVEDKLSMAHGLETRVPFLDNDLVDFAMRVPVRLKLKNLKEVIRLNENESAQKTEKFFNMTGDGKLILRDMLAGLLPPETLAAVKRGFSAPDGSWFKGESLEYVESIVNSPRARIYDFMDRPTAQKLLAEHTSGQKNSRLFIWSLLLFENWLNQYLP